MQIRSVHLRVPAKVLPVADAEISSPVRLAKRQPKVEIAPSESSDEALAEAAESDGSEAPSPSDLSATDDELDSVQWLQSKGNKGHLHLLGPIVNGKVTTRCGRKLHGAMPGHGMEEAVGTGAPWSPRCFFHLPKAARKHFKDFAPESTPLS